MALQQVETNEGVGEDEDIDLWIKNNKLTKAKSKLIEHDAPVSELKELANESTPNDIQLISQILESPYFCH